VADAALLLEVIGGHDPADSTSLERARPRRPVELGEGVEDCASACAPSCSPAPHPDRGWGHEAAEALAVAGARVEEVSIPEFGLRAVGLLLLAPAEASSNLARYDGVR